MNPSTNQDMRSYIIPDARRVDARRVGVFYNVGFVLVQCVVLHACETPTCTTNKRGPTLLLLFVTVIGCGLFYVEFFSFEDARYMMMYSE